MYVESVVLDVFFSYRDSCQIGCESGDLFLTFIFSFNLINFTDFYVKYPIAVVLSNFARAQGSKVQTFEMSIIFTCN